MKTSGAKAYLVNTGCNGTNKRISIKDTRGIIDAILSLSLIHIYGLRRHRQSGYHCFQPGRHRRGAGLCLSLIHIFIGLSFIYSAMYIGIMLVVDLLYGIIDPRIRLAKGDD